jgi:hypothetical protein
MTPQELSAMAEVAKQSANAVLSNVRTIAKKSVLAILDEIEASDDPKAKIAEIRKRLSL